VSTVGVIANPASGRDIRRLVAGASVFGNADKAGMVFRLLAGLGAAGVERVLMLPAADGLSVTLRRHLHARHAVPAFATAGPFPELEELDVELEGTARDTTVAVERMVAAGVRAIAVLGGDGTHRVVARGCGDVPICALSTGTNNAFPEMREPTITGLATGLYATGALPADEVLLPNKVLEVSVNDGERADLALVDVVVSSEAVVGARALWRTDRLRQLFVTFADPEAIGMSAIAGLLRPVGRREPSGLRVTFDPDDGAPPTLRAPIAPGLIESVAVASSGSMRPDEPVVVDHRGGVVALDGEREIELRPDDHLTVTLRCDAFRSIDVPACMRAAALRGLFHQQPNERGTHG
jgi:predicted polyphosphate/ATP-dependent NAD kinase